MKSLLSKTMNIWLPRPSLHGSPWWCKSRAFVRNALLAIGILATMIGLSETASAEQPFAACADEFWDEQAPGLATSGIVYALCAHHFATLYSGQTETPLYSAEHLTDQQLDEAIHLHRDDTFHADERLPAAIASTLDDYRHSGWDRGHMAPSGDEPDPVSQFESFALSNMVPQNSDDNRRLWADIETAIRELVLTSGDDLYVVTGPIFSGSEPLPLQGRVWVPLLLYKAVYDPKAGIAGVYVARNAPGRAYWLFSVRDFAVRYGINPFPGMSAATATEAPDLPAPIFARYRDPG